MLASLPRCCIALLLALFFASASAAAIPAQRGGALPAQALSRASERVSLQVDHSGAASPLDAAALIYLQQQRLNAVDGAPESRFGAAVSISRGHRPGRRAAT